MIEHGPNNGGQEWSQLTGPPAALSMWDNLFNAAARNEVKRQEWICQLRKAIVTLGQHASRIGRELDFWQKDFDRKTTELRELQARGASEKQLHAQTRRCLSAEAQLQSRERTDEKISIREHTFNLLEARLHAVQPIGGLSVKQTSLIAKAIGSLFARQEQDCFREQATLDMVTSMDFMNEGASTANSNELEDHMKRFLQAERPQALTDRTPRRLSARNLLES